MKTRAICKLSGFNMVKTRKCGTKSLNIDPLVIGALIRIQILPARLNTIEFETYDAELPRSDILYVAIILRKFLEICSVFTKLQEHIREQIQSLEVF